MHSDVTDNNDSRQLDSCVGRRQCVTNSGYHEVNMLECDVRSD